MPHPAQHEQRLDNAEARLDRIERRIESMQAVINSVCRRLDDPDYNLSREIDNFYKTVL